MINFSKVDTKENLLSALAELPDETESAPKELVAAGKAVAIAAINQLSFSEKMNGAHVNFRVNKINQWVQSEVQVAGAFIKPKAEK